MIKSYFFLNSRLLNHIITYYLCIQLYIQNCVYIGLYLENIVGCFAKWSEMTFKTTRHKKMLIRFLYFETINSLLKS